ncbi:MAG TPA: VCBS repeat-containing protein [Gemmataceae bacterium]|jgi:hypothetical protein
MSFISWLRSRTANRAARRRKQRRAEPPSFRPQLEALENRIVPSFSLPQNIPVNGLNQTVMAAADLTGNGKTDLVVGVGDGGVVVLMPGKKAGTFKAPVGLGSTNYEVSSIAVGDINNDGKPDIVVGEDTEPGALGEHVGAISVLLGNGKGGFGLPVNFYAGAPAKYMALADLNGDGLLDIVTDNGVLLNSNSQIALMNQGPSSVPRGWACQNYNFGAINGLALGDLNGDGRPDIVAMDDTYAIRVWLNNGAGGFTAGQVFGSGNFFNGELGGNGVALGDVNGDGKLDVVKANNTSNSVSVFAGNGDGTFNTTTVQTYAVGGAVYAVALGDFNKDGKLDIATAGAQMNVLLNNGAGAFGTAQQVGPGGEGTTFGSFPTGSPLVVGDFSGDGFPDLAQIDASGAALDVVFNNADSQTTGHQGHKG